MNSWAIFILAAAAFAGGWGVNGWRLDAAHQAEQNVELAAAIDARDKAVADRDKLAVKLANNNDAHAAQLRKAQNETNRIRDAVGVGSVGLRVAANCSTPAETPTAPGAAVDHGTGPELTGAARQDYFALRDGIDQTLAQLAACQGELNLTVEALASP